MHTNTRGNRHVPSRRTLLLRARIDPPRRVTISIGVHRYLIIAGNAERSVFAYLYTYMVDGRDSVRYLHFFVHTHGDTERATGSYLCRCTKALRRVDHWSYLVLSLWRRCTGYRDCTGYSSVQAAVLRSQQLSSQQSG